IRLPKKLLAVKPSRYPCVEVPEIDGTVRPGVPDQPAKLICELYRRRRCQQYNERLQQSVAALSPPLSSCQVAGHPSTRARRKSIHTVPGIDRLISFHYTLPRQLVTSA